MKELSWQTRVVGKNDQIMAHVQYVCNNVKVRLIIKHKISKKISSSYLTNAKTFIANLGFLEN